MDTNPYASPRIADEAAPPSLWASLARLVGFRPSGHCSFCGQRKSPLVEGKELQLICRDCAAVCIDLIDQWHRQNAPGGAP
jgi:hypothetical protein